MASSASAYIAIPLNSMKSKSLHLILAAGLFLFPALSVHANVDSILKLDMKGYFQAKYSATDSRESGQVGVVRMSSKQLIKLLSRQVGIRYPGGSRLKVAADGSVYIADAKGNIVGDVSEYFGAKADIANSLIHGKRNLVNGTERSKNYYPITFTINLPGLQGTFEGLVIEEFSVSAPSGAGVQFTTGTANSRVSGEGRINGKPAFFEGNLNLKGREASLTR